MAPASPQLSLHSEIRLIHQHLDRRSNPSRWFLRRAAPHRPVFTCHLHIICMPFAWRFFHRTGRKQWWMEVLTDDADPNPSLIRVAAHPEVGEDCRKEGHCDTHTHTHTHTCWCNCNFPPYTGATFQLNRARYNLNRVEMKSTWIETRGRRKRDEERERKKETAKWKRTNNVSRRRCWCGRLRQTPSVDWRRPAPSSPLDSSGPPSPPVRSDRCFPPSDPLSQSGFFWDL